MVLLGMDGNNSRAYAVPMSLCPAVRNGASGEQTYKFLHQQRLQSLELHYPSEDRGCPRRFPTLYTNIKVLNSRLSHLALYVRKQAIAGHIGS